MKINEIITKIKQKIPKIDLKTPKNQTKIETITRELLLIVGFIMVGIGLYKVYQPLMWTICGYCLMRFSGLVKGGEK